MRIGHKWAGLAIGAVMLLMSGRAEAGLINGSFAVYGKFLPVYGDTGATVVDSVGTPTFVGATGINFLNLFGVDTGPTGQFMVVDTFVPSSGINDFAGLLWTVGNIHDFTFAGTGSAGYPTPPIAGFETFVLGDLKYTLDEIHIKQQDANTLSLSGTGYFTWTGFDKTPGSFEFTGTQSGGSIAFVASDATPVPEPASMFLLGSGAVAGIGALRRRRQNPSA